jgi:hypothetical protein
VRAGTLPDNDLNRSGTLRTPARTQFNKNRIHRDLSRSRSGTQPFNIGGSADHGKGPGYPRQYAGTPLRACPARIPGKQGVGYEVACAPHAHGTAPPNVILGLWSEDPNRRAFERFNLHTNVPVRASQPPPLPHLGSSGQSPRMTSVCVFVGRKAHAHGTRCPFGQTDSGAK